MRCGKEKESNFLVKHQHRVKDICRANARTSIRCEKNEEEVRKNISKCLTLNERHSSGNDLNAQENY